VSPAPHGTVVAIEGLSASGKSTAARRVAALLGAVRIAEAVDRMDPAPSIDFANVQELRTLEHALLAEEGRRFRDARRLAATGRIVVTDTGFLGPLTYTAGLVQLGRAPPAVLAGLLRDARRLAARGHWGLPDLIVFLETGRAARARHAARDPGGHPATLRDRHEAVGAVERRIYREALGPLFGSRAQVVSGGGGAGLVAVRVARRVRAFPASAPAPPTPALVLRAVASFRTSRSPPRRR
jgi:hypothetical protein